MHRLPFFINSCPFHLISCRASGSMLYFVSSSDSSFIFHACNNVCIFHVAIIQSVFHNFILLGQFFLFSLYLIIYFRVLFYLLWLCNSFFLTWRGCNFSLILLTRRARAKGPRIGQTRCIRMHSRRHFLYHHIYLYTSEILNTKISRYTIVNYNLNFRVSNSRREWSKLHIKNQPYY